MHAHLAPALADGGFGPASAVVPLHSPAVCARLRTPHEARLDRALDRAHDHAGDHASLRPFVSGIQIQASAAMKNAADATDSAGPNPCDCASEPTVNGAAALATRPML